MADLSKLSDSDLLALKAGDLSKVSNEGLLSLRESPAPKNQPENIPRGGSTAGKAISAIPESALQFGKDIVQPFIHPIETAQNIGAIGKGVLQKLGIMSGKEAEPYADAVGKFFVDRYGGWDRIKKTLETDPVGMAADVSSILTLGGGAAARAPGMVGRLGEVAGTVGRVVDPLAVPIGVAKLSGGLAAKGLGLTTGVGALPIETAAKAGAQGGASGQAFRGAMTGQITGEEIVKEAKGAVEKMRQERGAVYQANKAQWGASTKILNFDDIDQAVNSVAGVKTFKGHSIGAKPSAVRQEITEAIDHWRSLNPYDFHTPEGIDALKQKIGEIRNTTQYGTPERKVAGDIYRAIRDTVAKNAPEYGRAMKGYEQATDLINEIEKTLSLKGDKVNIDTALRKLQSTLRNNVHANYGRRLDLAEFLVNSGAPHLIEKLAGMSMSSYEPRGLARLVGGGELLGAIGAAVAGNPALAAKLAAALAASSPKLVGAAAHAAGAATKAPLRPIGQAAFQVGRLGDPGLMRRFQGLDRGGL